MEHSTSGTVLLGSKGTMLRRTLLRRATAGALLVTTVMVAQRACASDARISIGNFIFSPTPLKVARGTAVIWENRDDIPHAIYCPTLNLQSTPLETNDTFIHLFDQEGTFDYICSIHPHMRGRVVVSG